MTDLDIPPGFFLLDGKPCISYFAALDLHLLLDRPIEILDVPICSSVRCLEVARRRTFWPSSDAGGQLKCSRCATALQMVADAMGFVLTVQELPPPLALLGDDTSRRFAMMELV